MCQCATSVLYLQILPLSFSFSLTYAQASSSAHPHDYGHMLKDGKQEKAQRKWRITSATMIPLAYSIVVL